MRTNENSRPQGSVVVVGTKLHKRLTKAQLIEFFEIELKKRESTIESLRKLNAEQKADFFKILKAKEGNLVQMEELRARLKIYQSETAQIRLIESLDRQLEMARGDVEYYKNLYRPFKTLIKVFFAPPKTCFREFWLPQN